MMKKSQKGEVDSIPLLTCLGVDLRVQRLFCNHLLRDDVDRLVFKFFDNTVFCDNEVFGVNTIKLSSGGIWCAGEHKRTRNVFLFFSAIEAIVFCHFNLLKYNINDSCLFVALGVNPSKSQVYYLKEKYPNATFHAIFGKDLIGRIYDCKVSLWLIQKDCNFSVSDSLVTVESKSKTLNIERSKFSYSLFCRSFSKRINLKIHKPLGSSANSFLEYLTLKNFLIPR